MTFGATLNRFAIFIAQNRDTAASPAEVIQRVESTEHIGIGMVILGVVLVIVPLSQSEPAHTH
jgi:hypothetical protein